MPQQPIKAPSCALSLALLSLAAIGSPVNADSTRAIEDSLKFGKGGAVKMDTTYRYEHVDQDRGPQKTANANTLRTRLGVLSPAFYGLQGYVEYEGTHVLQSDYNNGRSNKPGYSTVADPGYNELNQLWLSYAGIPDTLIKGGRQRIKLDDDRFIGNVGWRQLETTFDSVLITNKSLKDLTVNVGYIGNVQTFTATTENINAPILNANYNLGDYGNLIGYGYWLDYTERENFEKSSQTYGLRFINSAKPKKFYDHYSLLYTAEWSYQQDYLHSSPYQANRFNLMGGFTAYNVSFQGAMEQLNGSGKNRTFDTPLGTNHAFQGWADIFLATPDKGIRDVFGTVNANFMENDSLLLSAIYHDFTDDTGRSHYGKEWDFQAVKKFGKHYSLLAKYANYDADAFSTDTQKVWVQGNVNF
ncbi:alginate export family protein [Methylobacter sp. G7]|uniref:alginate export family protein n=1 Tax=Methylobacter sp. G7 TaxID=3230117 RepID=UPI003D806D4F